LVLGTHTKDGRDPCVWRLLQHCRGWLRSIDTMWTQRSLPYSSGLSCHHLTIIYGRGLRTQINTKNEALLQVLEWASTASAALKPNFLKRMCI